LQAVSEKHDEWLLNDDIENVITIDVNADFNDSENFKRTVIDRVTQLIKSNVSSMSSSSSERSLDEMICSLHC
jgi:deoxyadenosine/deoxycytidine kinase